MLRSLTEKAEPPPTRDVNRDSGTDRANGGWLRRLVRPQRHNRSLPNSHPADLGFSNNAQIRLCLLL